MKISIALATYNGERYLRQQLESYATQTMLPHELVVSDDRSTDQTVRIVNEFASRMPFSVKVVLNSDDRGVTRNFENAVRHCTGGAILFSDQDDIWKPDHVKKLVDPLQADPTVTVVLSNSHMIDQEGSLLPHTTMQSYRLSNALLRRTNAATNRQFELYMRHRIFFGHGMAFRSSLINYLLPFSSNCGYDQWVALLSAAAGRIRYIEEPLTLYRIHSSQASDNRSRSLFESAKQRIKGHNEKSENEIGKWSNVIERVTEQPNYVRNSDHVVSVIRSRVKFMNKREEIRRLSLVPRCVQSVTELMRGRYHKFSRGLLAWGRDVCAAE